ncbi:MAG: DEAD/DEAH box helicase [Acidobacteria bacterium]|nr:DEAD/DEAH box helicase [Acidobacteriota bacterium]
MLAGRPAVHHGAAGETVFDLLIPPLKRALEDLGYQQPTPIQEQSIPDLLHGRDMLGCAQTGTGKTAAFMLPILQYLDGNRKRPAPGRPRVLVLTPTRELAAQIGDNIADYGKYLRIAHTVIFGGVKQNPQVARLRRGLDVLVATPGRLLDLMQQGHVGLGSVEVFVLDEADRMLDMGFMPDIRRVVATLPAQRQSLFFSATLGGEIAALASTMVSDPVTVTIAPEQPTVEKIQQKMLFVEKQDKDRLLASILADEAMDRVIVFTRTKHGANKVVRKLETAGIPATAIHGNKSQAARTRAMGDFKAGRVRVLVATDIAARGIDVQRVSHVINYDLPNEPEVYVHRIGRTARAGLDGVALSFCSAEERGWLRAIERLLRQRVPEDRNHRFHSEHARTASGADAHPAPRVQQRSRRPFSPRSRRGR